MTRTTSQVLAHARELGFTVTEPYGPHGGRRELALTRGHLFGAVVVGASSGRILRANLTDARTVGRHMPATTHRATGARDVRALLTRVCA